MNKFKVFGLLLMILLPVNVFALTGSVSVSCYPAEVKPGDESTCTVKGSSSPSGIAQFELKMTLPNGLSLVPEPKESDDDDDIYFTFKSSWQGDGDISDGLLSGYRENETSDNFNIGTFKVKVAENAEDGNLSINFSDGKFCMDYDCTSVDSTSATIKVVKDTPATPTGLKNLTVTSGGTMASQFSEDNKIYMINLNSADTTTFSIKAEAKNENDSITAINVDTSESIDLSNITFKTTGGNTSMSIKITAGSEEYIVNIVRPIPTEVGKPLLSSLVIGGKSISLSNNKFEYQVTLSDLDDYTVVATLQDSNNFKFSDNTNSVLSPHTLSGEKEFVIQILPKDNDSNYGSETYTIKVVKESSPSSNSSGNSTKPAVPSSNPGTGQGGSMIIMALVLVASFGASIYFYRRNMNGYN